MSTFRKVMALQRPGVDDCKRAVPRRRPDWNLAAGEGPIHTGDHAWMSSGTALLRHIAPSPYSACGSTHCVRPRPFPDFV